MKNSNNNLQKESEARINEPVRIGKLVEVQGFPKQKETIAFGGESPQNLPKWLQPYLATQLHLAKGMAQLDLILTSVKNMSTDKVFDQMFEHHFVNYQLSFDELTEDTDKDSAIRILDGAMAHLRAIKIWLLKGEDKYFEWCEKTDIMTIQEMLAIKSSTDWNIDLNEELNDYENLCLGEELT